MSQAHANFDANVSFEENPEITDNMANTIAEYKAAENAFKTAVKDDADSSVVNSASAILKETRNAMLLAGRQLAHFIRVGDQQYGSLEEADEDEETDAKLCDAVFTEEYIGQHNQAWHDRHPGWGDAARLK